LTTDAPAPLSAYGRSKLLGEQQVQQENSPGWIIARLAWLYGPGGASFPKTILNHARAGKPLKVVSDQVGCPTYTFDVAEAILSLVDKGAAGVFHLVNSGEVSWFGFTQAILEEFEVKTDLQPITAADWAQMRPDSAVRPAYSVLDTSDYVRVTGRSMRPWRDGLKDFRATGA
jgi:dTDP-4-dehydrorhamnose reductase